MARTIPTTTVQELNKQSTSIAVLTLLEVTHSALTTVRIVDNTADVVSNGNTYTAFPFAVTLPADTDQVAVSAQVRVANATRLLVPHVRTISGSRERALVTLTVVDSTDPDTALVQHAGLELVDLSYDADFMIFSLSIDNFLNEPFPSATFSPRDFPALF